MFFLLMPKFFTSYHHEHIIKGQPTSTTLMTQIETLIAYLLRTATGLLTSPSSTVLCSDSQPHAKGSRLFATNLLHHFQGQALTYIHLMYPGWYGKPLLEFHMLKLSLVRQTNFVIDISSCEAGTV